MLEIHAIQRYVIAPAIVFDAREFCTWLRKFVSDRGRLPKELLFTFREPAKSAFNAEVADRTAKRIRNQEF